MSLGPLMVDLRGTELLPDERELLAHPQVGGVILFSRNYAEPGQLISLVRDIHSVRSPALLVAVDQEGGRVQRFRDGFTRLPPLATFGRCHDRDPREALSRVEKAGWLMAIELLATGVDISFAPVLDLDRDRCSVIGDRALHRDPEVVAELARSYQAGMKRAGMAATGKHFPGHGAVVEDSHHDLPIDSRKWPDLEFEDLVPFQRMIHSGMAGIMMAHVIYPDIDGMPAGFSRVWIRDILRGRMGFQGAVFSDDLSMGATESYGDYESRARLALEAGCDMLPVCNAPDDIGPLAERLEGFDEPAAHVRLARMHARVSVTRQDLLDSEDWKNAVDIINRLEEEPLLDMDL